jgi:hypothetical protein
MAVPTESDKVLLQAIVMLTEQKAGRPPSLAEIAIELGYQSSSRANVQRQLMRLRPEYVDWNASPRSLHVTAAGQALLGITPPDRSFDLPVSEAILPLMASGLTYMTSSINEGKSPRAPYHLDWHRGLNMLAAECLIRGINPPTHTAAAIDWCHRPLKDWPVRFPVPAYLLDTALLEQEQPTELCREYAYKGGAEMEACQKLMERTLSEAKRRRAPHAYVALRQHVIETPVMAEEALMKMSFDPRISPLGANLTELYERVPTTVVEREKVLLCGFCGWTLQRYQGRLRCGDDRCRVLTGDFIQPPAKEYDELPKQLYRVRRAIRRYIVAPGIYEINAMKHLRHLGLSVELWPGYDTYDLHIAFPNGEGWAVDVKDWRFPHLLARHLTPLQEVSGYNLTRAFYAVPDERVRENPQYLDILQNATAGVGSSHDFTVLTIGALIEEARKYKEQFNA